MKKLALFIFLALFAAAPAFAQETGQDPQLPKSFKVEGKRIKIDGEVGKKYIVLAADGIDFTEAKVADGKLVIALNVTNTPRGMLVKGIAGGDIILTTKEGEVLAKKVEKDEENITFNRPGIVKVNVPKKKS